MVKYAGMVERLADIASMFNLEPVPSDSSESAVIQSQGLWPGSLHRTASFQEGENEIQGNGSWLGKAHTADRATMSSCSNPADTVLHHVQLDIGDCRSQTNGVGVKYPNIIHEVGDTASCSQSSSSSKRRTMRTFTGEYPRAERDKTNQDWTNNPPHDSASGTYILRLMIKLGSSLVGQKVGQIQFESIYGATVEALLRDGCQVRGNIHQHTLKPHDILVVQASSQSPLHTLEGLQHAHHGQRAKEFDRATIICTPLEGPQMSSGGTVVHNKPSLMQLDSDFCVFHKHCGSENGVPEVTERPEFVLKMVVKRGSPVIQNTPGDSGLQQVPGVILASIEPGRAMCTPNKAGFKSSLRSMLMSRKVSEKLPQSENPRLEKALTVKLAALDEYIVKEGDVLVFVGELESFLALRKIPGLVPLEDRQTKKLTGSTVERSLVQAVVAPRSPLSERTVKELRFRTHYDAVILTVYRSGERVNQAIGDLVLRSGDVLLLDCGPIFMKNHAKDRSFALVSEITNSTPPRFHLLGIAVVTAIAMISLAVANVVALFTGALFAVGILIFTGCLTARHARDSVNWEVITTIAAAFGISEALERAGVSVNLANWFVQAAESSGTGEAGLIVAVYTGTVILSFIVANNAAAALMFPVASTVAVDRGVDLQR
eukprot:scaffold207_cov409-Prasinococcus_capsulatus_cf.AAC.122